MPYTPKDWALTDTITADAMNNIETGIEAVTDDVEPYVTANVIPTGAIMACVAPPDMSAWLLCDGSVVARLQYSALFAVIGTTFGAGDGSTTFKLPDMRGRVPVGRSSSESGFDTLNEKGGAKTVTLDASMLATHTHTQQPHDHGGTKVHKHYLGSDTAQQGTARVAAMVPGNGNGIKTGGSDASVSTGATPTNNYTGGGNYPKHNNLQPYLCLYYAIKA